MRRLCLVLLTLLWSAAAFCGEVDTGRDEKPLSAQEAAQLLFPGTLPDAKTGLGGRFYSKEQVAKMIPWRNPQQWKLRNGRTEIFSLGGWEYRKANSPAGGHVLWLYINPVGRNGFWYRAADLAPDEQARLCKNMWAMMWQRGQEAADKAANPAPASKDTAQAAKNEGPFSAYDYNNKPARSSYLDKNDNIIPPFPPLARPAGSTYDGAVWPAGEEWTFADGHKENLALYSWGWKRRQDASGKVDFRLLCCVAGTTTRRDVNISDLAPTEADKVNLALWRRFHQIRQPDPAAANSEEIVTTLTDSPAVLSARYRRGLGLSSAILPLPGYELVKPRENADRSTIPALNQGDFGSLASDCLPSSLAVIFLWWDEIQWLPLTRKGGFERKAEWLHRQFGKEMRTLNNRGTNWENAHEGLDDFALKQLGGEYAFQIRSDKDYSPENLARYATGTTGTVLSLSVWKGSRYSGGHAVPLVSADTFGNCEIVTWGCRIKGRWQPVDLPGRKAPADAKDRKVLPAYELKIESVEPESKWQSKYRFILDSKESDGLHVIIPNRRVAPPTEK